MKKISFKKIERVESAELVRSIDTIGILEKTKDYMLYERRLSPYNTKQSLALLKKIILTYKVSEPSKELGFRVERDLSDRGRKPRTIRNNLMVIELWADSQDTKDKDGKPLKFKKPKIAGHRIDSLTTEEARLLLDHGTETLRDDAIIKMLIYLCLRSKELINADIEDVDLINRIFYVRSKHDIDIKSPGIKTYRERTVIIPPECAKAIKKYLEEGRPNIPTKALIFSNRGTRLSPRTLEDIVSDAAKRAGLVRRVYPYLLRHTGCTFMCRANINLHLISMQMGHSNIQQTLAYSHPDQKAMREVIDKHFVI